MKSLVLAALVCVLPVSSFAQDAPPVEATADAPVKPDDAKPGEAKPVDDKAALFARLDANKDGAVQLSELPPELKTRLEPLFQRLKKDAITLKELEAASTRTTEATGTAGREAYFASLDADKDGSLTVAEVPEGAKALVEALLVRVEKAKTDKLTQAEYIQFTKPGAAVVEPMTGGPVKAGPGLMKALDANGDGKLSKEELATAAAKFDTLDADGSGHVDARELLGDSGTEAGSDSTTRNAELTQQIFGELDADKNGTIDQQEAAAKGAERLAENFERIDESKDGTISLAEFTKSIGVGTTAAPATPE